MGEPLAILVRGIVTKIRVNEDPENIESILDLANPLFRTSKDARREGQS